MSNFTCPTIVTEAKNNGHGILFLTYGIPGCGKSTFLTQCVSEYFNPENWVYIQFDNVMHGIANGTHDPTRVTECHKICFQMIVDALKNGCYVVYDDLNLCPKRAWVRFFDIVHKTDSKLILIIPEPRILYNFENHNIHDVTLPISVGLVNRLTSLPFLLFDVGAENIVDFRPHSLDGLDKNEYELRKWFFNDITNKMNLLKDFVDPFIVRFNESDIYQICTGLYLTVIDNTAVLISPHFGKLVDTQYSSYVGNIDGLPLIPLKTVSHKDNYHDCIEWLKEYFGNEFVFDQVKFGEYIENNGSIYVPVQIDNGDQMLKDYLLTKNSNQTQLLIKVGGICAPNTKISTYEGEFKKLA
jgi:hypothetical protein